MKNIIIFDKNVVFKIFQIKLSFNIYCCIILYNRDPNCIIKNYRETATLKNSKISDILNTLSMYLKVKKKKKNYLLLEYTL